MALLGDLELTLGAENVQDESEVPSCEFCGKSMIEVEDLPLGIAQDCNNCRLLLDAWETWDEIENSQLQNYFFYPKCDSFGIHRSCIQLRTKEARPRTIYLRVSPDASRSFSIVSYSAQSDSPDVLGAKVTVVKPLWLQKLSSIRVLNGDTSSDDSINTLKTWIDTCNCQHQCFESGASQIPDRLLQITEQTIFLRENLKGTGIIYSCLSHCWGVDGLNIKLTQSNRLDLCRGIPCDTLPKTFREAVQVCIQLGVEYLWIDALCELRPLSPATNC